MRLVAIQPGEFSMGAHSHDPDARPNEQPRHRVRITQSFYLSETEVTVGQYEEFTRATGYKTEAERDVEGGFGIDFQTGRVLRMPGIHFRDPGFPGFKQTTEHPVILISWADAEAFCRWLSEKENQSYRLPTEAEWEYAARAGTDRIYPGGDNPSALDGQANVADRALRQAMPAGTWASPWDDGWPYTAPVRSFPPNDWGLYDMQGNVWEWSNDWHDDDYYAASPADDPRGPNEGRFRAIRGGGWFNAAAQQRPAQRIYFDPTFRYCLLSGFRVLLESR